MSERYVPFLDGPAAGDAWVGLAPPLAVSVSVALVDRLGHTASVVATYFLTDIGYSLAPEPEAA